MSDVSEDSGLVPAEKQFSITTTKADAPEVRVHSEVGSITRSLLDHGEFTATSKRKDASGDVVAVTGTLPIGCLTIKGAPRQSSQFNQVVSPR